MIQPGFHDPGFVDVANGTLTRRRTEAPCARQKAGGLATRRLCNSKSLYPQIKP